MSNKTSTPEWKFAENVGNNIRAKINTYYMESVLSNDCKYVKTEVLVPITENINMTFEIDVPYEMMDCGNTELLEYFREKIYPS